MDSALGVICELLEEHACFARGVTGDLCIECEADIKEFGQDNEITGVYWGAIYELEHSRIVRFFVFPSDVELDDVRVHKKSV